MEIKEMQDAADKIAATIYAQTKIHSKRKESMTPTVRARFKVISVLHTEHDAVVKLEAVNRSNIGNEDWSKFTPSGQLQMTVNNFEALDTFIPGHELFLDFTPNPPDQYHEN